MPVSIIIKMKNLSRIFNYILFYIYYNSMVTEMQVSITIISVSRNKLVYISAFGSLSCHIFEIQSRTSQSGPPASR